MQNGSAAEKVEAALGDYKNNPLFSQREQLALEMAERMTYTNKRVTDKFFARLKRHFTNEELVELAAVIASRTFAASSTRCSASKPTISVLCQESKKLRPPLRGVSMNEAMR